MQARVSRKLHDRIEGLPKAVRDIAWKGQAADVPALPPSGRGRKGEGGRHHSHRPRDGWGFIWAIARAVTPPPACQAHAQG